MLVIITIFSDTASARNYNNKSQSSTNKDNPKYASLVMDADTGRILSKRYADKKLHPASLTKIMTLLLVFEALDRGEIQKSTRVRISSRAASMVPSKLGLKPGSRIRVEDAIKSLATKSANDVAVALAEHLGGSESRFAMGMTKRARTIGMKSTTFRNASGLHDQAQVTTARDMAKMARYILKRYPHYYKYFSTRSFTYKGKTYKNHNRLLESYPGMDGFKTGYINASGFNLVASAHRNGRRLIGVVFGGRSGKTRNAHMANIMDAGFRKVKNSRTATNFSPPPKPSNKPTYGVAPLANQTQPIPKQTIRAASVTPPRKPPVETSADYASLSSLNAKKPTKIKTATASTTRDTKKSNNKIEPNYTALTAALKDGRFGEMIGEGDFDPSVSKRLETGLIAVAVHKGEYIPNPEPASDIEKSLRAAGHAFINRMDDRKKQNSSSENINSARAVNQNGSTSLPHPKDVVGKWSVQIGAYKSRLKTDDALRAAKAKLPATLQKVSAMTVPLQTDKGMMFRARLGGMSESEARQACGYFKECIAVAPIATRVSGR